LVPQVEGGGRTGTRFQQSAVTRSTKSATILIVSAPKQGRAVPGRPPTVEEIVAVMSAVRRPRRRSPTPCADPAALACRTTGQRHRPRTTVSNDLRQRRSPDETIDQGELQVCSDWRVRLALAGRRACRASSRAPCNTHSAEHRI